MKPGTKITLAGLVLAMAAAGSTLAMSEARGAGAARTVEQQLAARVSKLTLAAKVEYKAAIGRCAALPVQKACHDEAKITRDASIRLARIQKAQRLADLKDNPKPPKSADELYASEKARCDMMGLERESCHAEVKQRFKKA